MIFRCQPLGMVSQRQELSLCCCLFWGKAYLCIHTTLVYSGWWIYIWLIWEVQCNCRYERCAAGCDGGSREPAVVYFQPQHSVCFAGGTFAYYFFVVVPVFFIYCLLFVPLLRHWPRVFRGFLRKESRRMPLKRWWVTLLCGTPCLFTC